MTRDTTRETIPAPYGALAAAILELLLREWDSTRMRRRQSVAVHDDYIAVIHRLATDRYAGDAECVERIAAYLNFVERNHIGENPDKTLNRAVAERIVALAETARQPQLT